MSGAESWNERYLSGDTPWDYGGIQPEFNEFLNRQPKIRKLLIPGCGNGHDVEAAAKAGLDVTCVELSRRAAENVAKKIGPNGGKIIVGDFFHQAFSDCSFDAVFERTFLCAIDPEMRRDYARRMSAILKPGGFLFGFFFFGEEADPPPHPLHPREDHELFGASFELIESAPSRAPLPRFEGVEKWLVWRKK